MPAKTTDQNQPTLASFGFAHAVVDFQGALLSFDSAVEDLLGVATEEIAGLKLGQLFPSLAPAQLAAIDGLARRTVFCATSNRWLELRLRSHDKGLDVLLEDVTQSKTGADKTRLMAAIVTGASDFIAICDADLKILYLNPAGLKLIGKKRELGLEHLSDLLPAWALHRLRLGIDQVSKTGQWEGETALLGPSNEEIPHSQMIQPLFDDDGKLLGYATIARNIADRQRREKQLRDSESRFRRAIVEAPIPVLIVAEDGELLAVSESLTQLTGYQPREFDRLSHWLVTAHRDDSGRVRDSLANLLREQPMADFDAPVYTRTGTQLFWRFSGTAAGTLEDGRRYAVVMALDMTDRLEKERALEEGTIFLRRTLDSLNIFAGVCTPDGTLIETNRVALEAADVGPEDVLGKALEDTYWWAHDPEAQARLRQAIHRAAAGNPSRYDAELQVASGDYITLDFQIVPMRDPQGRVSHLVPSGLDITERKRIEEEVEAGRERFRSLLDATAEGIFGVDREGFCTFANASCAKFLGYDGAESLLGKSVFDLFYYGLYEGMEDAEKCPILDAFRVGNPVYVQQAYLRRADQTFFPVECWAHPTFINGELVGCVANFLDIRQRLETARELSRAKTLAEAANRAKSDFLANMSHEIRTPMAAIIGYVDILLRQSKDPDNTECLQIIQRNGAHLLEIINDILDLSKIEAGSLEVEKLPVSVRGIVQEVVSLMGVRAQEKDVKLLVEFEGPIPETISSDPTRLRQILMNLLGNATKFTSQGQIRLMLTLDAENELVQFTVEDSGIGIPEGRKEHLFEPFSQADTSVTRRFGGTGLGLAISRQLIHLLGGTIEVESQEDVGTTFRFTIATGSLEKVALVEPAHWSGEDKQAAIRGPLPSLSGRKVLVVDDRRDIRFLVQSYLEEAGATVGTADNGQAALDYLAETRMDMVVLDMQMPVLDGYATARELRRRRDMVPILAVTASAMTGDREACLAAGCNSYLSKPVDRSAMVHQVANLTQSGGGFRVLIVEDNPLAARALKAMLNTIGCEADIASDGQNALEVVLERVPDYVLLDLGLPDMDGWELLGKLKSMEALADTKFIAHTGKDPRDVAKHEGPFKFDIVAQKPLNRDGLLKILFS